MSTQCSKDGYIYCSVGTTFRDGRTNSRSSDKCVPKREMCDLPYRQVKAEQQLGDFTLGKCTKKGKGESCTDAADEFAFRSRIGKKSKRKSVKKSKKSKRKSVKKTNKK